MRRIETDAVDQFNDQMKALLERFDDESHDRIWIERCEDGPSSSAAPTENEEFVLRTLHSTDDGLPVRTLSNTSARASPRWPGSWSRLRVPRPRPADEVPFMLLDSGETNDAARIAALIDYFAMAPLPEDIVALGDNYDRITEFGTSGQDRISPGRIVMRYEPTRLLNP